MINVSKNDGVTPQAQQ